MSNLYIECVFSVYYWNDILFSFKIICNLGLCFKIG